MLNYIDLYTEVKKYFPTDRKETEKMPRQYIANIIHTVVGKPFREWSDNLVKTRNVHQAEKKEMFIELDPEVQKVFDASTSVSCK